MSQKFQNIKVGLDETLEEKLQLLSPNWNHYHIIKKSVDARRRHDTHFIYSVEVFENGEVIPKRDYPVGKIDYSGSAPLIVGSGPAGLFAAVRLVERGIPCHIFERGSQASERMKGIVRYWRYGQLDPKNNVCFGEGGAGLYSDGKLITRIKSPHIPYVMERLVRFGAPEEIKYLSNPHVGSDKIRRVIPKIRAYIEANGGTFHFDTRVSEVLFDQNNNVTGVKTEIGQEFRSDHVILACGHSAEDIFDHLKQKQVAMEGKSFAIGLRVEHPQTAINQIQYRQHADHPQLGAANYKLTYHNKKSDFGVYSFCMCPGGYVLSSGTEPDGVVSNGMSNYNRNSAFANAAIVATIDHDENFASDVFGGLNFRRQLEQMAFNSVQAAGGNKELPAQTLLNFLENKTGDVLSTSSPSGVVSTPLHKILPKNVVEHLKEGFESFGHKMRGFVHKDAQVIGVETRTSCPIRIVRDKVTLQSTSHKGLYPTGEGAGYAGGITSAACDGINVAEAIVELYQSQSIEK